MERGEVQKTGLCCATSGAEVHFIRKIRLIRGSLFSFLPFRASLLSCFRDLVRS